MQDTERDINSAYENTVNQGHPTSPVEDLLRLELKPGYYYHTISQERESIPPCEALLPPPTNMTGQTSHITATPMQVTPAPIRVIPTHISIRQSSWCGADYAARQFLDLCEAAIVNSSITEDHDKITFIRSCLLPGSRSLLMMQSSAFASADIGTNHDAFKKMFIFKIFFRGKQNKHCQIAHIVETLQKNASTKPIWDGMIEANQLAIDCIKTLKDTKWVENSQMLEDNLKKCLEFLFYQLHIPEKARRSSLTLNFKPGSKVVDFVPELEVKILI